MGGAGPHLGQRCGGIGSGLGVVPCAAGVTAVGVELEASACFFSAYWATFWDASLPRTYQPWVIWDATCCPPSPKASAKASATAPMVMMNRVFTTVSAMPS